MSTLVPVLLAGGEGKRLWPLSSNSKPKQFLKLAEEGKTLFNATVDRAMMLAEPQNIITVASKKYNKLISDNLEEKSQAITKNIIWETEGRNTAAAIAMAANYALDHFNDPVLWIMPCDHLISKPEVLVNLANIIKNQIIQDKIITFGIKPSRPDSNYGYIIPDNHSFCAESRSYKVGKFVEKPEGDALSWVLSQSNYFWNSGMFVFSAITILEEIKKRETCISDLVIKSYKAGKKTDKGFFPDSDSYKNIPQRPIDKVVMEENSNLIVYPVEIGWSDVGSWFNIWELSQQGANGDSLERFLEVIDRVA